MKSLRCGLAFCIASVTLAGPATLALATEETERWDDRLNPLDVFQLEWASDPQISPDGKSLIFSANRHPDWEYEPRNSELYEVSLSDRSIRTLTDREGPDHNPAVSPGGERIAYLGYDDQYQGYQVTHLYVMDREGSGKQRIATELDRTVASPVWSSDGKGLFFLYNNEGNAIGLRGD